MNIMVSSEIRERCLEEKLLIKLMIYVVSLFWSNLCSVKEGWIMNFIKKFDNVKLYRSILDGWFIEGVCLIESKIKVFLKIVVK